MVLFTSVMTITRWLNLCVKRKREWRHLLREFAEKNWTRTSVDQQLRKLIPWHNRASERHLAARDQFVRCNFKKKTSNLWKSLSAVMKVLCTLTKVRTKLNKRGTFYSKARFCSYKSLALINLYQRLLSFAKMVSFFLEMFQFSN